jgi:hypothetical protein
LIIASANLSEEQAGKSVEGKGTKRSKLFVLEEDSDEPSDKEPGEVSPIFATPKNHGRNARGALDDLSLIPPGASFPPKSASLSATVKETVAVSKTGRKSSKAKEIIDVDEDDLAPSAAKADTIYIDSEVDSSSEYESDEPAQRIPAKARKQTPVKSHKQTTPKKEMPSAQKSPLSYIRGGLSGAAPLPPKPSELRRSPAGKQTNLKSQVIPSNSDEDLPVHVNLNKGDKNDKYDEEEVTLTSSRRKEARFQARSESDSEEDSTAASNGTQKNQPSALAQKRRRLLKRRVRPSDDGSEDKAPPRTRRLQKRPKTRETEKEDLDEDVQLLSTQRVLMTRNYL